jgi:GT2 family glycosyltransferase
MSIPKIIHQIWIGPKPMPSKFMETWKIKNPDYEYICWTEEKIKELNFTFRCQKIIDIVDLYHGKADIMRLEILYKYGGIYLDADSICIEPLGDAFLKNKAFATYENEIKRGDLVANGNMGFVPNYSLCEDAINYILDEKNLNYILTNPPWVALGPGLLTSLLKTEKYKDFVVYPSHTFLPLHFTGEKYYGHKKVYAFQEWGSTKQHYDIMNEIELPPEYCSPQLWVSILISSYNTKHIYVTECLESIKNQNGHFGIEIVWINDGSSDLNSKLLDLELKKFERDTRFTTVKYIKMDENKGISYCLNRGVEECSYEIILKMDSDDIMFPDRIAKQVNFMGEHPDCVMCGSNIQMFKTIDKSKEKQMLQVTNHKNKLTWDEYKGIKSHWIMNHPSLCYKKSAVLSVGNYNIKMGSMSEDLELELRVLKKYGVVYNIEEPLLYYRIHPDQTTYSGNSLKENHVKLRNEFIEALIHE